MLMVLDVTRGTLTIQATSSHSCRHCVLNRRVQTSHCLLQQISTLGSARTGILCLMFHPLRMNWISFVSYFFPPSYGSFSVLEYSYKTTAIMNYDVFGPFSSTTGPNAPLNDSCAPASSQQGSALSALNAWTGAGFPASQIVLGVPAYGHSYRVNNTDALVNSTTNGTQSLALYTAFDKANEPHGDKWDSDGTGTDVCGNPNVVGGVFTFWGMIEGGFLDANGTVVNGMVSLFDDCSQTVCLIISCSKRRLNC